MPRVSKALLARLATVELALFDVDGTMTDGGMWQSERGGELKCFDVKDGLGIVLLRATGIRTGIVSARTSRVVAKRAAELKIPHVVQGLQNKADAIARLQRASGVPPSRMLFMGDDVNDLPLLERVGVSAAPRDAASEVCAMVDYLSACTGGHGAVREVCEVLLRARGLSPRMALNTLLL